MPASHSTSGASDRRALAASIILAAVLQLLAALVLANQNFPDPAGHRVTGAPPLLLGAYGTAVHDITIASLRPRRPRLPLEPLLLMFAAVVAERLAPHIPVLGFPRAAATPEFIESCPRWNGGRFDTGPTLAISAVGSYSRVHHRGAHSWPS